MAAPLQLVGQTLSHYRIIEQIGAGGMGVVYRARDEQLERDVAVKVLPIGTLADESARTRFRKEALALAKLNHPNIATIFEFNTQNDTDYLVTEYISGLSLDNKLAAGALSEKEVMGLGIQLAQGLGAAHEQGIVHRDLKPANLRLTSDGRLKILDFGLAQLRPHASEVGLTATLTESQQVTGTLPYMAPEQLRGEPAEARTDIWAAGAVLYEMATAHRPFEEKLPSALAADIIHKTPPAPRSVKSGLSRKLEGVILKCLEKEPGKRYPSARELQSDLERLSAGVTPLAARRLWRIIATSAIVVVMLGVGAFFYLRQSLKLTEKDTVVLADFVNTTGEAVFDAALKQALIVQLEQSPFLNVLSDQKVSEQLKYMGRSTDERLTQDVAREVCQRSGSKAMLVGSISGLGSHYAVGLKTVNCRTGDSLGDEQLEAESREKILKALGEAATKMRGKLGESLSTIAKYDTPIQQATTPSLEALNAFALGTAQRSKGAETESIPFFKRAIELDPNFALAEAVLGQAYSNLGERELANEHTTKAFKLRARVSEHERLYISSHYYGLVTGEMDKTVESFELWKQIYPRESDPLNNLAVYYDVTGQFEKGVQEAQEALRLDPNGSMIYANLAWGHLGLNQWAKGKAVCDQAIAKKLDGLPVHVFLYLIAFVQGEKAAMQREVDWASGKPIEDVMLRIVADAAASSGHLQEARQFFRRSVELAQLHNFKERAALTTALEALTEGQVGNHGQALELARSALTMGHGTDVQEIAAQALASSGDRHQPQAIADNLGKRFPTDTFVNSFSLPVIRGAIELERGNATKAVDYLQAATPYEFGVGAIPAFPGFAAIYLRGQAYLRGQDGKGAAIEFQKILDHRGTDPTSLLYALAHLGLARAYAISGDTAKARSAYQDFFALWKDADPNIPILKEAKAEYAKLQ